MEGSLAFVDTAAPGEDEGNPILNLDADGVYQSLAEKIHRLVGQKMLTNKGLEIKSLFNVPTIKSILNAIDLDNDPNLGVFHNYKNMLKDRYENRIYLAGQFGSYFTDFVLLRVLWFCGYDKEEIVRAFLYDGEYTNDGALAQYYRDIITEITQKSRDGVDGLFRITNDERESMYYSEAYVDTDDDEMTDEDEGGDSDFVLSGDDDDTFSGGEDDD